MAVHPDQAAKVAEAALKAAREYFRIDPAWKIELEDITLDAGMAAQCVRLPDYRKANVQYDSRQHDTPQELWGSIGHEAAHVLLAPLDTVQTLLQADFEWREVHTRALSSGLELVTMTLEDMFTRDCPYLGDEAIEGLGEGD